MPETTNKRLPRVAITHGDTNGIGYELIYRCFEAPEMFEICTPIIYGAPKVANYHRKAIHTTATYHIVPSADEAEAGKLNIVPCIEEEVKIEFGQPSPESGEAARIALRCAVEDLKAGKIDVLVTAPINKQSIHSAEFPFAGHTEYLEDAFSAEEPAEALMVMVNSLMRVAVVTTHLPLAAVPAAITQEAVEHKARLLQKSLERDFLISSPRIAVLGLNPHAGDGGVLGTEEEEIIRPAVKKLVDEGLHIAGPYPADAFFAKSLYRKFDAVLAMYHDQGLIPFKALAESGVNFTAGLPIVRTSPDHGTAYDIAGRGVADASSMREAIYTAIDVMRHRAAWDEAHANPLPKLFHERRENDRLNFS